MRRKAQNQFQSAPEKRPTTGQDMLAARMQLDLTAIDANWLFGTNATHWRRYKIDSDTPLKVAEVPIALLMRYLLLHPERTLVPEVPSPESLYQIFSFAHQEMELNFTLAEFGLGLGRQSSAGHRWVAGGSDTSAVLSHILVILARQIESVIGKGKIPAYTTPDLHQRIPLGKVECAAICAVWREWWDVVLDEATARGLPENFHRLRLPWGKTRFGGDDAGLDEEPSEA